MKKRSRGDAKCWWGWTNEEPRRGAAPRPARSSLCSHSHSLSRRALYMLTIKSACFSSVSSGWPNPCSSSSSSSETSSFLSPIPSSSGVRPWRALISGRSVWLSQCSGGHTEHQMDLTCHSRFSNTPIATAISGRRVCFTSEAAVARWSQAQAQSAINCQPQETVSRSVNIVAGCFRRFITFPLRPRYKRHIIAGNWHHKTSLPYQNFSRCCLFPESQCSRKNPNNGTWKTQKKTEWTSSREAWTLKLNVEKTKVKNWSFHTKTFVYYQTKEV